MLLAASTVLGLFFLVPAPSSARTDPSAETHPEWGTTSAPDAKLRKGCRGYGYTYAITPPEGYWSLETFLVGRRGRVWGSGYFVTGEDPLAGPGTFRLCRRSTHGGQYTIRALLTVEGDDGSVQGWLPETTLRLRKPRQIDWKEQFERATEAFDAGRIIILVDDKQASSLDEAIVLRANTDVAFLRLMPLVGG